MKSQSSAGKVSTKKSVMYLGDPGENEHENSHERKAQPLVSIGKVSVFGRVNNINVNALFQKRYGKIRDALMMKKKQRVSRSTIVFIEGSSRRKNLAYYDPAIYELLKIKKRIQVKLGPVARLVVKHIRYQCDKRLLIVTKCLFNRFVSDQP